SMISETHTRYGVRCSCQGRSWRPARACQSRSAGAIGSETRTRAFYYCSVTVAERHVPAHGLDAHAAGAVAARAGELRARPVLAVLLRLGAEAVADVAREAGDLVGEAAGGAGAHGEVAAHRGGLEGGIVRQLALEAHVAGGGAGTHRAGRVERDDQRAAHRVGLELAGTVLEVHVAAHAGDAQARRLAVALELDVAADGLE